MINCGQVEDTLRAMEGNDTIPAGNFCHSALQRISFGPGHLRTRLDRSPSRVFLPMIESLKFFDSP
jgi:hypothetical protein